MKLNLHSPALVAILGLALTSLPITLHAQTPATAPAPAADTPSTTSTKKSKPTEYQGTLTAIDTTANTVSVTSTAKVLTLAITPKTTIQKNKKTAKLADFAVGDSVTGSYTTDASGTLTAHSLRKKTKTATGAATSATPATPAATPAQ
jgi:hypothetical protein